MKKEHEKVRFGSGLVYASNFGSSNEASLSIFSPFLHLDVSIPWWVMAFLPLTTWAPVAVSSRPAVKMELVVIAEGKIRKVTAVMFSGSPAVGTKWWDMSAGFPLELSVREAGSDCNAARFWLVEPIPSSGKSLFHCKGIHTFLECWPCARLWSKCWKLG